MFVIYALLLAAALPGTRRRDIYMLGLPAASGDGLRLDWWAMFAIDSVCLLCVCVFVCVCVKDDKRVACWMGHKDNARDDGCGEYDARPDCDWLIEIMCGRISVDQLTLLLSLMVTEVHTFNVVYKIFLEFIIVFSLPGGLNRIMMKLFSTWEYF